MVWDWPEHFLDRVAQMVLATLYTHHHLDVGASSPSANTKNNKIAQVSKANIECALKSAHDMVSSNNENNPDLGVVVHKIPGNTSKYRASEAYENCVAAAILNNRLYLAVNFKVRRNATTSSLNKLSEFSMSGFNEVNERARLQILEMLRKEIKGVSISPKLPGEELADGIQKVVFVGPYDQPDNCRDASAFHAEMQLVSYLKCELERSLNGVYFGVNKPCCQDCTLQLKKQRIQFAGSHNRRVTNWKMWSSQRTCAVDIRTF